MGVGLVGDYPDLEPEKCVFFLPNLTPIMPLLRITPLSRIAVSPVTVHSEPEKLQYSL